MKYKIKNKYQSAKAITQLNVLVTSIPSHKCIDESIHESLDKTC